MTKISTLAIAAALSVAILLPAARVHAAPILVFSNFGPNKTVDNGQYDVVSGPGENAGGGHSNYLASSFTTPTFGIFLDHIDLTISSCAPSLALGASVDLVPDDGGKPNETTATVIKHWLVTKLPCGTAKATKLSIPSTQSLTLAGSTTYWVVVTPIGFGDFLAWSDGLMNNGNGIASQDGGQTWVHFITEAFPYSLDVWRR